VDRNGQEYLLIEGTLFKVEPNSDKFFSIDQPLVEYKLPIEGLGIEFYSDNEDSDGAECTDPNCNCKNLEESNSDESIDLMDSEFDTVSEDESSQKKTKKKPVKKLQRKNIAQRFEKRANASPLSRISSVSRRESFLGSDMPSTLESQFNRSITSKSVSPMKNRRHLQQTIPDKDQNLGKKLFNTLLDERNRLGNLKKDLAAQIKKNQEISKLHQDSQQKSEQINQEFSTLRRELELLRQENQSLKQKNELLQNIQNDNSPVRSASASPLKQSKLSYLLESTRTPENSPQRIYNNPNLIQDNNRP
jgi:hypothetical protein